MGNLIALAYRCHGRAHRMCAAHAASIGLCAHHRSLITITMIGFGIKGEDCDCGSFAGLGSALVWRAGVRARQLATGE
jgi:hypothetical protein